MPREWNYFSSKWILKNTGTIWSSTNIFNWETFFRQENSYDNDSTLRSDVRSPTPKQSLSFSEQERLRQNVQPKLKIRVFSNYVFKLRHCVTHFSFRPLWNYHYNTLKLCATLPHLSGANTNGMIDTVFCQRTPFFFQVTFRWM